MNKKLWICICAIGLIIAMTLNLSGCAVKVKAANLMEGITSADVEDCPIDEKFRKQEVELALKLLRSSVAHSEKENLLISPLSIQLALAMTANGGVGQTGEEMESLLGGEIPLEQLNGYLHTYSDFLKSGKNSRLHIANSIWFRDDEGRLEVNRDFLQTNSNYYGAQAYKAPFDEQTVKDINQWVKEQTNGMIDSIVEEISTDTMLYLINALSFDGKWEKLYNASDIWDGTFHSLSGEARPVEMMSSKEWCYLKGENVTGFIKDYKGGDYGFAALLPGEGMDIYEYVNSLQPQELMTILKETEEGPVQVTMPKFTFDYELSVKESLKTLGMESAFDPEQADFSAMAQAWGNLYIGDVLHKTHISVDAEGTKAAAVTAVEVIEECTIEYSKSVVLNRPFLFMILDRGNNLPVFMGIVTDITS